MPSAAQSAIQASSTGAIWVLVISFMPVQPGRRRFLTVAETLTGGPGRPARGDMAFRVESTYSDRMGMIEYHTRLSDLRDAARAEVSKVVVGNDAAVDLMLVAAICHGHVLVEGPPGAAKTLLANAVARVLGVNFKRIQFTPDTTASEIVGKTIFKMGVPEFQPGVLFTNVLLADEINRTPPKTQA